MQLKYLLLSLVFLHILSCKSSVDNQSKKWLNDKELYNTVVKYFFNQECKCERLDNTSILAYDIEAQIRSREINFTFHFNNADSVYKNLMKRVYELGIIKNGNLLASAQCSNGSRSIFFSNAIYDNAKRKAIIYIKLNCGIECAETQILLLDLKSGRWLVMHKDTLSEV